MAGSEEVPAPPVEIWVEAAEAGILDEAVGRIWQAAHKSGAVTVGPVPQPSQVDRYLVVRAEAGGMRRRPYELRTHRRQLKLQTPSPATLAVLLELELPGGVDIRVVA